MSPAISSLRGLGFFVSGTTFQIATRPTATIGTLIRKTEPQELPSTHSNHWGCCKRSPPRTGPSATAPPTAPAHAPIALPRSWGGNTTVMMAKVVGSTAAPPIPMSARMPINMPAFTEKAARSDASAKMISPITRTFLRPIRSPITPQVNSRAANTKI